MRLVHTAAHRAATKNVRDLMSRSVVAGDPGRSLVEAAAAMRAHRIGALAVLDGSAIVGIITERDFLRAIADGRHPDSTHVWEYMTSSPLTIEAGEPAAKAAEVMVAQRVRHLPVTDEGRLVGFISARDLLSLKPWPKAPIGESW
jgi:CBS domain-containing protein